MKSIRTKIFLSLGGVAVAALLILGVTSIILSYNSSMDQLNHAVQSTAEITASRVEQQLLSYRHVAEAFGTRSDVADPNVPVEQKQQFLNEWIEQYGMSRANLFGENGISIIDGTDITERDYYQICLSGETYISSPTVNKATGELSLIISAPVWEGGREGSKVIGLVNFIPGEAFLNEIMSSIHISDNNSAYMIDKNGYTIADITMETINEENIEEEASADKALEDQAKIHEKMRAGESGIETCSVDGKDQMISYAPVGSTDGWSLAVTAPLSDFMQATYTGIIVNIILVVAAIILILAVSIIMCNRIVKPIKDCANRLVLLAEGDLQSPVPVVNSKDETRILADSTRQISEALSAIIGDETRALTSMAKGNFDIDVDTSVYVGAFREVCQSIQEIDEQLSQTLREIDNAANQVSAGSEQVSSGAQALSQGATEQASSVEELAATVQEISAKIGQSAKDTESANNLTAYAGDKVNESTLKMQELVSAMGHIKQTSQQIQGIIKTIDDIAFQTNILALNAAVEAARAGASGKGFAVVADEVRSLAGKSAEASKDTQELIQSAIQAVEHGSELAEDAAKTLEETAEKTNQVVKTINTIASASAEQAHAADQISQGLDQISSVVQTNSATAEESAAASEQLSGQANMLKVLVGKFKLSDSESADHPVKEPAYDYEREDAMPSFERYADKY